MELVPAVEMMRRWAAARPDAPAATVAGQALTRGALELHGNRTCHGLEARGVKEGDIIALRLPNRLDLVQALVGTLKAGAIPLPLPPQMPAPEVQAIVEVARPALLVGGGPAAIEDVDYIDSVEELSAGHPEDTPLTRVSPLQGAALRGQHRDAQSDRLDDTGNG